MELLCDRYEEMMFDFLDGELTKSQAEEFKYHLNGCVSCSKELMKRRKTIHLIADSAYVPEKNLNHYVISGIRQHKKNRLILRYGSTIAACVVAAVILTNFAYLYIFQNKSAVSDALEQTAEDSYTVYTENNLKTFGADDTREETKIENPAALAVPPPRDAVGAETDPESAAEESPETPLMAAEAMPQKSDPEMIIENTKLYAPDYIGKISMVIISENAASSEASLIKDASNYKVYIVEYTPENASVYRDNADTSGSTVYIAETGEDTSYILYIYLTQS